MEGLYRGAIPNAQRAAVVNGVQIPTYDVTKRNLLAGGFSVSVYCFLSVCTVVCVYCCLLVSQYQLKFDCKIMLILARKWILKKCLLQLFGICPAQNFNHV